MSENEFVCPQCHSANVQNFALVYGQNVSQSQNKTFGGGVVGGDLASGVAVTNGTSVTGLGQAVAPPLQKSRNKLHAFLMWFFGYMPIYFLLASILPNALGNAPGVLALIILGSIEYKIHKKISTWNKEVWPGLYDEWQHSYLCLKCGHSFVHR